MANQQATREEFSQRIKSQLKQIKRSKAWLASEINISRQAMNWLLNHAKKTKYLNKISAALGVDPDWLQTGVGQPSTMGKKILAHKVPVYSEKDILIGRQNKMQDVTEDYIIADAKDSSINDCFAYRLSDKSMEPIFPQGSKLIFKNTDEAKNGNFVLAQLRTSNKLIFRQYLTKGTTLYLHAFNQQFPPMAINTVYLLGKLAEYRVVV
jgi:SOS-response transcriptional repressor LexA